MKDSERVGSRLIEAGSSPVRPYTGPVLMPQSRRFSLRILLGMEATETQE